MYTIALPHSISSTSKANLKPGLSFPLPLPIALCLAYLQTFLVECSLGRSFHHKEVDSSFTKYKHKYEGEKDTSLTLFKPGLPLIFIPIWNFFKFLPSTTRLLREGIMARAGSGSLLFGPYLLSSSHWAAFQIVLLSCVEVWFFF